MFIPYLHRTEHSFHSIYWFMEFLYISFKVVLFIYFLFFCISFKNHLSMSKKKSSHKNGYNLVFPMSICDSYLCNFWWFSESDQVILYFLLYRKLNSLYTILCVCVCFGSLSLVTRKKDLNFLFFGQNFVFIFFFVSLINLHLIHFLFCYFFTQWNIFKRQYNMLHIALKRPTSMWFYCSIFFFSLHIQIVLSYFIFLFFCVCLFARHVTIFIHYLIF